MNLKSLENALPAPPPLPPRNIVYTDGCCTGNQRDGTVAGWAMYWGEKHPDNSNGPVGGAQTHFRAGLWAAANAAETAYYNGIRDLTIITDSSMLTDTLGRNIEKWTRNGWKTQDGTAVPNRDLIEELDMYRRLINIEFKRPLPNFKMEGNEIADAYAWKAAKEALESRGRGGNDNNTTPTTANNNSNNSMDNDYNRRLLNIRSGRKINYNPVPPEYYGFPRSHRRDVGDGYDSDSSTTTCEQGISLRSRKNAKDMVRPL